MKAKYTTITKLTSTPTYVEMVVQLEGEDEGQARQVISVSVHKNQYVIHFSGIAGKILKPDLLMGNQITLKLVERNETDRKHRP